MAKLTPRERFLDVRVRHWCDVLRLDQWAVAVKLLPEAEFYHEYGSRPSESKDGFVRIYNHHQEAQIVIRDDSKFSYNTLDSILLHELLHIVVDRLDQVLIKAIKLTPADAARVLTMCEDDELEQVVNDLVLAFYAAINRGIHPEDSKYYTGPGAQKG